MVWMRTGIWIIVGQGIRKGVRIVSTALCAAVDMETKDWAVTWCAGQWQSGKFCCNQGAVGCLVEPDFSSYARIGAASPDNSDSPGRQICQGGKIIETVAGWHKKVLSGPDCGDAGMIIRCLVNI